MANITLDVQQVNRNEYNHFCKEHAWDMIATYNLQESNMSPEFGEISSICMILDFCDDENPYSILWYSWHHVIW
jgi:hypothetical protein